MNKYELLLAISEGTSEENRKKLVKDLTETIEKASGRVEQTEGWGKKALAFPVKKNKNGFYWLLNFEGKETLPEKINGQLRINDKVLRYLTTKKVVSKKVKAKKKS